MAGKMIDISGNKYNRLTVLKHAYTKNERTYWLCRCDCGNTKVLRKDTFTGKGGTKSCGCMNKESKGVIHGKSRTKLYSVYHQIKQRCYNDNDKNYKHYGGRGVEMCSSWLENFNTFYMWAINEGYKPNLTIDRINVDGHYEPDNCRWITQAEQLNNTRRTVYLTYNGTTKNIKGWSDYLGMSYNKVYYRLVTLQQPIDKLVKCRD